MLKAGALYFAIVVAFLIAVISASLIMVAAHYRNSFLRDQRYQTLEGRIASGIAYSLADVASDGKMSIDLYGDGSDSVLVNRTFWGIYELVELKAFIQQDTLSRNFLMGKRPDSIAVYLSDEDRALSISGSTKLVGDVQLPKSGLRQAYAEGKPYTGDKLVYKGRMDDSGRELPPLNEDLVTALEDNLKKVYNTRPVALKDFKAPFGEEGQTLYLGKMANLKDVNLDGKLVLIADSVITITSTAKLKNIQIYAPVIKVEEGFSGNCQLFASDSLLIAKNSFFGFPSAVGVLKMQTSVDQPQLVIGSGTVFHGAVFSYEKERSALQTMISIAKGVKVEGEVFCKGILKVEKQVEVKGKVSCNRFVMRTPETLYENFLIDVTFNRLARNKYYLSSPMFAIKKKNMVLQWLN